MLSPSLAAAADELADQQLAEHRKQFHDPRDLIAEPCCPECCDCQDGPPFAEDED